MAKAQLKLITPLWTGDATKKVRHIEGTGLLGSLRSWYETLIRGMGGWACGPTSNEDCCTLDTNAFKERLNQGCEHSDNGELCPICETKALAECGLCAACQLFGATGWAKTFRLGIDEITTRKYPPAAVKDTQEEVTSSEAVRVRPCSESRGYFFPPGLAGSLTFTLLPRRPKNNETVKLLLGLLDFIRRNAALGAKTGLGYGLFEWENKPKELPDATWFATEVSRRAKVGPETEPQKGTKRWPDLREMFFARIELPSPWRPEDFANFKYDLRGVFREGEAIEQLIPDGEKRQTLRHFLLGTITEKASQASKIKMALSPKRDTLRVWGWVPKNMTKEVPGGIDRKPVMELIYNQIKQIQAGGQEESIRWWEFDSDRDRDMEGRFTDPQAYLRSLMEA